jgi:hypothetical protein
MRNSPVLDEATDFVFMFTKNSHYSLSSAKLIQFTDPLQTMLRSILMLPHLFICLWLYSPCGFWLFLQFVILYTVGRTAWPVDQPFERPLRKHRTTQIQNKRTQTSMPRVGLEPAIPVFERAKTVPALDGAATVIGFNATVSS